MRADMTCAVSSGPRIATTTSCTAPRPRSISCWNALTRPASEIGKGLAPAREARPIRVGERIHVLGAAGAAASAAVLLAHRAGASVSGCDPGGPSPYVDALEQAGVPLVWQHSADHVLRPDDDAARPERLSVTKALTAVDPDHPELEAARELGLPTEPWQQL